MSKETIVYEVKLQPAVIVLLGVIALGVVGNVFKSVSPIQDAIAELSNFDTIYVQHSGSITVH
jgi:hypothetical protein